LSANRIAIILESDRNDPSAIKKVFFWPGGFRAAACRTVSKYPYLYTVFENLEKMQS